MGAVLRSEPGASMRARQPGGRDTTLTASFDAVFAAEGTGITKTPVRAPRANAICERVIDTLRRDYLDWTLVPGRHHLKTVLFEYTLPRSPRFRRTWETSTSPGYAEPIVWADSSTSIGDRPR
jgi:hypothetical protein